MAITHDLKLSGFRASSVKVCQLNISHPDPLRLGPFCRLAVETTAGLMPGVYAWVVDDEVRYVGMASHLVHVVSGARMQRACNDYTYVPASKVAQSSSPRVRVNGLLNRVLGDGAEVSWWWLATDSVERAKITEARLIHDWGLPLWNRAVPALRD